MSPVTIGIISLGILLLFIFLKMPIGYAMALVGFLGFSYLVSLKGALRVLAMEPFATGSNYMWGALGLFILMGQFAFHSGVIERLYETVWKWLGNLPAGLSFATLIACAGFAAVSASSLATAATMGAIALPQMKKYGYAPTLATGCIAAGGTLGILIPPSGIFIMYGILTEQSINELFIAGIFPGILLTVLFILTVIVMVSRNPKLGPRGPKTDMKEKIKTIAGVFDMLILVVLVLGGLWGGFFTPNEAGAVGAGGALIIGLARRKLTWQKIITSLTSAVNTTTMILVIVIGAMIFNRFLAVSTLPAWLASSARGLAISPIAVLILILIIYAFLGCVFDSGAIVLLTIPIFYPVIVALGFDLIWFGVLMALLAELGLITPPIGMNVYVLAGIEKSVPLSTIFKGVAPFIIPMVICITFIIIFPQIALVLVNAMR